jgi:DNA-binding transcriptional ArsR family regulator
LRQEKYQEREREGNRSLILWSIIYGYEGPSAGQEGATFEELREVTGLSAPTLSSHLKALQKEGLIQIKHEFPSNRLAYVVVDRKAELMNLLRYFIQREKTVTKESRSELHRLEQATHELEAALKPFGKLPPEIQKLQDELDRAGR